MDGKILLGVSIITVQARRRYESSSGSPSGKIVIYENQTPPYGHSCT